MLKFLEQTDWKKAAPMLGTIIAVGGTLVGIKISQGDALAYADLATGILGVIATFVNTRKKDDKAA